MQAVDEIQEVVNLLVEEGRRIGKAPWCADGPCALTAYCILNSGSKEEYPRETYLESQKRYCEEGVITQEEYQARLDSDKKFRIKWLFYDLEAQLKKLKEVCDL